LPIVYWMAPHRFRHCIVATTSLVVLVALDPIDVLTMLGLSLVVYGSFAIPPAGKIANRWGSNLAKFGQSSLVVLGVLLYLCWYKYMPSFIHVFNGPVRLANILPPIGISYFSFKLIHYALDRRRGTLPPHKIQEFLSWLFLLPTFTSGPIERFEHFVDHRENQFRSALWVEGWSRIIQGLVKKFVLTEKLAQVGFRISGSNIVSFAHGSAGVAGAWAVWAYLTLDLLIFYLDFSAYSDIAIGASKLFGFTIMENFNYPLLATSLHEFWRRWHMSLVNWCRAYIYMPMVGLTRNPYLATLATFVVMGFWHAASFNWVAWGIWNGCGLIVVQWWVRFALRRRITFLNNQVGKLLCWTATMVFLILGEAPLAIYPDGTLLDAFHLVGRAFGLYF
jgi:alginate O-acetyltransferase complex protein AlgI